MGSFSITHWLILAVVVVIFGTSKLKNAGKDLGNAVKGFKDAVKEEDQKVLHHQAQTEKLRTLQPDEVIVKDKTAL